MLPRRKDCSWMLALRLMRKPRQLSVSWRPTLCIKLTPCDRFEAQELERLQNEADQIDGAEKFTAPGGRRLEKQARKDLKERQQDLDEPVPSSKKRKSNSNSS